MLADQGPGSNFGPQSQWRRPATPQNKANRREDMFRLGHAAGAEFAAGHVTLLRADPLDAVAAQERKVALRRRVVPHPHIHRRRDQHLLVGRHQQGRGQIIRMSARHLRHQIRRGGRHHHQIGIARQLDMAHLRLSRQVEQIAMHILARQCRDRKRRHEFLGCAGQDRHDPKPFALEVADQCQRLVGGDPATDNQ